MSINPSSQQFRKVDVDQYNDNNYEEVVDTLNNKGPVEANVQSFLNMNKKADAMKYIIENSITSPENSKIKDDIAKLSCTVLGAFKSTEMTPFIESLDEPGKVTLLKYVYRGFEFPQDNSNTLLNWHEKIFEKIGKGGIVKVLNDRKRV